MRWSTVPAPPCATIFPAPAPGPSCRRGWPSGETVVVNAGFVQNTMQDRAAAGSRGGAAHHQRAGDADRLHPLSRKSRHADAAGKYRQSGCGSRAIILPWRARSAGVRSRRSISIWKRRCRRAAFPKPGPLEVHLKDDHLQYAITWFGLGRRGGDCVRGVVAGAAAARGPVGWAKARLRRAHQLGRRKMVGTLRFAHPTACSGDWGLWIPPGILINPLSNGSDRRQSRLPPWSRGMV